ncbi:MAG: M56 family metallopeptidase [Oscillospiraceae bacterium]|nr:M56 family metallopeptidase [Oscillospiraceae bacterium]
MDTSIFSFLMSLFWCSIFILFSTILRHKKGYVLKNGVNLILLIMAIGIIRLFIPIEPKFSTVIRSSTIMPFLQKSLGVEVFRLAGIAVNRFDIFIAIWAFGSIVYLIGIIIGILKLKHRASQITAEENEQANRIMSEIVLKSKPNQKYRIIVSPDVGTPMLVGYFTPTVLIPPLTLSDDEMKYVLLHEWNHFLHMHLWTKLLFNVLCALLWWNPLVYLIKEDMDYVLEVNCDRSVVNRLDDAEHVKYVESTINVMKQLASKPQLAPSSIGFISADSENIVQRCELVLFPPKSSSKLVKGIFGSITLALVVLSYAFIVQPATPPPMDVDGTANVEYVSITPQNSFLLSSKDNTYDLFVDGKFLYTINPSEVESLPYSNLPINDEEDHK